MRDIPVISLLVTGSAPGTAGVPGATLARTSTTGPMTIDTHQHFWNLRREPMPWMRPEHAVIARDFEPSHLRPLLDACGIDGTILVQSACTDTDTDAMFAQAAEHPWIRAVTAWVDLLSPGRTRTRLDTLAPPRRSAGSAT